MRIEAPFDLPVEALIGAVITSDDGAELGVIADIRVDITQHEFVLYLSDGNGLRWCDLKDYSIKFQSAA
jgi:sporulation protein YlmC with PRC-barrel domain